jgi:protein O-mannosyl-transferase
MTRARAERPAPAPTPIDFLPWPAGAIGALIFALVFVVYWPSLGGGFLWDDNPGHVTRPELRSLAGLFRIWFEPGATQQYYPVLHSAFWFEHRIWGDNPAGYRLINLLLHATAACLVGTLLRRLAVPGAGLAALLFALHPVAVESVAWISEQKNTLSTVLYLCAALVYLRFDATRRPATYAWATALFVVALGTKTVTATLPAALLVILWWHRGRLDWRRDVQPVLPWFALSVGAAIVTASFEHSLIGAQGADFELSVAQRLLLAGRAVWFYFAKLLWPANLIFVYPRWTLDPGSVGQWLFPLAAAAMVGTLWWRRMRRPGPLAVALLFGGLLFPALGFVNVFPFLYSFVADHFQYLASIAVFALLAAGWAGLERVPLAARRGAAALVLVVLAALTWRQSAMYRSVFTLYEATLARNPHAWMAHNNLAIALVDAGRASEALPHYEAALKLRPNYAEAENNYGYALTSLDRAAEALPHLQRAVQLQPKYAEAHNNLGRALMALGRADEGRAAFAEAVRLNPNFPIALVNLGLAHATAGQTAQALPHFARAAELDPNYADAELNWGIALVLGGRVTEALPHFERAVRLRPDFPPGLNSHGRALAAAGRYDEALARFRAALELDPNYAEAHHNLALALRQLGRNEEAGQAMAEAQRLGFGR